jgi:hypothetical protein
MRKVIVAFIVSITFIISGISATTFSGGQLVSNVWAEDGD